MSSEEIVIERFVRRTQQANIYFLEKIGESLKQIRELTPTQAQQLIQILKFGDNYDNIVKQIAKYMNLNIEDIDKIFKKYAEQDLNFKKEFYKYRNIPFLKYSKNIPLKTQVEALSNITKNEMYNFTRSNILGYSIKDIDGNMQFLGLRDTYNRVLDEAMLNIGQGKESFDSGMSRIMSDLGGSGLKTVEYESGRSIRLDSAVRMHLAGRLNEMHNEAQRIIGEQFGADGIEITVHDNPAPDHAEAQGRQFTLEEFEKLQTEGFAHDYEGHEVSLHRMTKKGLSLSFRPISEMNCYHVAKTIVLGVSEAQYNEEELQDIIVRSNKGFIYEGKHYTNYQGTQLQRALERKIREQKDIQILGKSTDNNDLILSSQEKITQLTQKYKELSNISGLLPKMEKMRVGGYRRTKIK